MKTAMQELIQLFENEGHFMGLEVIRLCLEKEKDQIIQAHENGLRSMGFQTADFKSGNKYYHRVFGDNPALSKTSVMVSADDENR
jgi:hypothetical protein